jgi:hypothetical protein
MSYETQIFAILENLRRDIKTQPLILGSSPTTSGTGGGPPGGIIGHLRQDKVSFDVIEAEDFAIPASGMSLVTNLNRIRYRISQLEDNPVAVNITVLENGTIVSSGVEQINFVNASVVETVPGSVTVTCSGTGGGSLTIEEADGTPSVAAVTKIKVANGSLTDNGAGVVTIATGGGGTITLKEVDGTPSISATTIVVPNGSLTDDGGGQGTLTFPAGGAGATDILQVQVFS